MVILKSSHRDLYPWSPLSDSFYTVQETQCLAQVYCVMLSYPERGALQGTEASQRQWQVGWHLQVTWLRGFDLSPPR